MTEAPTLMPGRDVTTSEKTNDVPPASSVPPFSAVAPTHRDPAPIPPVVVAVAVKGREPRDYRDARHRLIALFDALEEIDAPTHTVLWASQHPLAPEMALLWASARNYKVERYSGRSIHLIRPNCSELVTVYLCTPESVI